jgi:hypothetical protein
MGGALFVLGGVPILATALKPRIMKLTNTGFDFDLACFYLSTNAG